MMDVILNNDKKAVNGHSNSTNIPTAAGGLPGVRSRTRQTSSSNDRGVTGSPNLVKLATDTEEDDASFDQLLKSTLAVPKGQPPKKRTKKYGERKSCKHESQFYFCCYHSIFFFALFKFDVLLI